MFEARTEHVPTIHAAGMPHVGAYNRIGPVFDRVFAWARGRGLLLPGRRAVGVYYDSPRTTPEDRLRSHACLEVDPDVGPDMGAGVEIVVLPAGRCAVGVYKGEYAGLPKAWAWLTGEWMPARKLRIDHRPCFEVYLNDPDMTHPSELLTAIHVPIVD